MESCKRLKVGSDGPPGLPLGPQFKSIPRGPILLTLPASLSIEIYEYSSPDTFAHLALVSREVSATSQHYRKSGRYAFSLMRQVISLGIDHSIEKLRSLYGTPTVRDEKFSWMGVIVGEVLLNTILTGSLARVADETSPYTDETIIRAARYCAVGFQNTELLWWAAQRENNPDALSLFRAEPLELTAEESMCLQFINSHPRGIGRYEHNDLQGDTKVVNDYVNSSPRAMWAIVRHARPEYKLRDVFTRMLYVGPCHRLLGIIRVDGYNGPVFNAGASMLLAEKWYNSKTGVFNGSATFKALASCAGTSAEYSEALMHAAVDLCTV